MKLSVSLLAASTVTAWQKKEWEVQDAYFAGDEIVLSDPTVRKCFDYHHFTAAIFVILNGGYVKITD